MIAYLSGQLHNIESQTIIMVANGVGYEVEVHARLLAQLPELGSDAKIYIYHNIKEDSETLFGFITLDERNIFKTLLKVSGVGPRLAHAILSALEPKHIVTAIVNQDLALLKQVKGLGAKVAQRITTDLKSAFNGYEFISTKDNSSCNEELAWQDAVMVLTRLGYKSTQAEKVVLSCRQDASDLDHLIRLSLKSIAKDTVGTA